MRLASAALVPYRLPLTEPVVWNGVRCTEREGVLLRLCDSDGRSGWGDAAPLPGFSRETLAEASDALAAVAEALIGRDLDPHELLHPDGEFHRALDASGALPSSARFALDLALADLAAQALGRTLPHALHPDPEVVVPLAGLLMGEGSRVRADADRLVAAGYRTLKLKVGRGSVEDDADAVLALVERLGPTVALRLDANRAWTVEQATRFAERLADTPIDFIEEPLRDPAGLPELWLDTRLRIALDETLQAPGAGDWLHGWAAAAVLKPTLVGGLMATLRLAAQARAVGVRPVLSASFESGVGLRGVAALAAVTGGAPVGLDTARWLAADVLDDPWPLDRPSIDVPALFSRAVVVSDDDGWT